MKMRVHSNAIRFRLNRKVVAELAGTGQIRESVEFAPADDQQLVYAIKIEPTFSTVAADYQGGRITVRLPQAQAREWLETERIGLDGEQMLGSGRMLRILVEKDFQCLHTGNGRAEGEIDHEAYPNPLANAHRQKAG